jgi:hypothetical protein
MSVLDDIYNTFNPMPLPAGSPQYVDFRAVRGGSDVSVELGRRVCRSSQPTCQLFSGHLGGGKSTELLKLAAHLEAEGFTVVYFSADDDDINTEDVEYSDILLACTRHLLEVVKEADPTPVVSWLRDRWTILNEVMQTEISLPETSVEASIQFAKITSKIRTQKTQRAELRTKLNPYTEDLVVALNKFIKEAKARLPQSHSKLIVIADGLEKIQYIVQSDGQSNHEDIFITKAPQLKSLDCHVIYTMPVSLALSTRASDLMDIYGCSPDVLPMVTVRSRQGVEQAEGMAKMREMLRVRVSQVAEARSLELDGGIFEDGETLDLICRMSGGHVRNLVILMQYAIDYQDRLPLTRKSVELAVRKMRRTYRESVNAEANEWDLLAQVSLNKIAPNDNRFRSLLFRRCILQYLDEAGETWHDVHPLLEGTEEFQAALRGVTL